MLDKIEWFEDDGCMGGSRGLTIYLKDKKIVNWNGTEEIISKNNLSSIEWVIKNKLQHLESTLAKNILRLDQKNPITTKISGGYSTSMPLTENQRNKVILQQKEIISIIAEIKSISISISVLDLIK